MVLQGGATQHTQGRGVMQLCGLWIQEKGVEEGREREQAFIDSVSESVYWLFFWWLCFRVPCFVIQSQLPPGITKLLKELSGHSQGYFSQGLTSRTNRLNIFQHPGSRSDEEEFFYTILHPF